MNRIALPIDARLLGRTRVLDEVRRRLRGAVPLLNRVADRRLMASVADVVRASGADHDRDVCRVAPEERSSGGRVDQTDVSRQAAAQEGGRDREGGKSA